MPGAILSFLGGWWVRWFGRTGNAPSPEPAIGLFEPAAPPEPISAPAMALREPDASEPAASVPADKTAEQSFLETVRMERVGACEKREFVADAQVREVTLEALKALRQIPALQSLVQGVTRIMAQDGVSIDEIVEALQKDSALCVRVLSMANSAAVASESRVVDLQTAVHLIGVSRIRRLAQAVFTMRDAQRVAEGLDWRHLWIHALATADIAEELERRIRPSSNSQVHMAGLLHDVGKIVLSTVAADAYRDVLVASWNGEGRLEDLERRRFGVDHREAGVIFARGSRLSDIVIDAIAHHDDPTKAEGYGFEVALVSAADFISKARGLGFSGARLDASDGELEELPAWKVLAEQTGWAIDVAQLEDGMSAFFATLRSDMRSLHEVVA